MADGDVDAEASVDADDINGDNLDMADDDVDADADADMDGVDADENTETKSVND